MPATTTLLGLVTPTQGTLSGTWGDTVNYGISDYVDIAIAGTLSFAGDGAITLANTTGSSAGNGITSTTAQYMIIRVTGTQTVTKVITGPSYSKMYLVDHAGATSAVTFKASGQTGVSVAVGEKAVVYYNGTDYVKVASSTATGNVVGPSSATDTAITLFDGATGKLVKNSLVTVSAAGAIVAPQAGSTIPFYFANQAAFPSAASYHGALAHSHSDGAMYFAHSSAWVRLLDASTTVTVAQGGTGQTTYTDGQLLIGNTTGNTLTKTTLTAGSNITITNGSGAITIAATASASAATPTALGTVYGKQTTSGGTPYLTAYGYSAGTLTTGIENVAFGVQALELNVTGTNNTMLGTYAGSNNTNSFNVAVGSHALRNNTSGANNIAIGYATLVSNNTGSNNVGVGHQALNSSTTDLNTAIGYRAAYTTVSGYHNVAVGADAFYTNNSGLQNVAVGYRALYSSSNGNYNTAVGKDALQANTTDNNTAVGYQALYSTTSGTSGVAVGYQAGYSRTTVSGITAIGYQAGYSDTNPYGAFDANVYLGYRAGYNTTTLNAQVYIGSGAGFTKSNTGGICTLVGNSSGYYLTTGVGNTCLGYGTMNNATTIAYSVAVGDRCMGTGVATGLYNVAIGQVALQSLTSGSNNTAVGMQAMNQNTTGSDNTALGLSALYSNTGSTHCTAIGRSALISATGEHNTAVGSSAMGACTSGSYNTAIGYSAGGTGTTTGSNNTYVGYGSVPAGNATHEIVIGTNSAVGKGATTGFISPNGGGVYQGNNSANWTTTSDRRLKKNIVDNNVGLEKLTQIQVRNFEYRLPEEVTELPTHAVIKKTGVQLGVIAQELQTVLPDCIKTESTGVMSVDTDNLTWYMINAIKELKAEVDSLKSQLNQGA